MDYHHVPESSSSLKSLIRASDQRDRPAEKNNKKLLLSSAVLVMLICLGVGISASVGHLLYYQSLHGRRVSSSSISQEWNIRIGTMLAFVSKTSWTVAVITAQAQQVWRTLDQKQLPLNIVDGILTATSDLTAFRHGTMLAKAKVASVLALVAWLIPLSTILTPATLTVVPKDDATSRVVEQMVPDINFDDAEAFASLGTCGTSCGLPEDAELSSAKTFRYPNAQTIVEIASTTAGGRIQSMSPQYPNSTYTSSFFGPAFWCSSANSSTVAKIDAIDLLTAPSNDSFRNTGGPWVTYYAFAPGNANGSLVAVDFANLPGTYTDFPSAIVPMTAELWIKSGEYQKEKYHVCALYNSTFTARFSFDSGAQSTKVEQISNLTRQPYVLSVAWPWEGVNVFGNRILSYQAIFVGLARQLVGRFYTDPLNTQLFQTPVIGATEFIPHFNTSFGAGKQPFARNLTIPRIIEELSQNITLGLLASAVHTGNGTRSEVTVYDTENTYKFNARDLILVYAISVVVVAVCVVVGYLAVVKNKGARTVAFSALVYATKESKICKELEQEVTGEEADAHREWREHGRN